MEDGRLTQLFDASAYLLFEASGDSEAQYFDGALELESPNAAAEDDAQSCSYGSVSNGVAVHEVDDAGGDDSRGSDFDDCSGEEDDDGGGSEEEDGVVDQCRGRRNAAPAKEKPDSNAKMMNEREGDRLFWEACLAS